MKRVRLRSRPLPPGWLGRLLHQLSSTAILSRLGHNSTSAISISSEPTSAAYL